MECWTRGHTIGQGSTATVSLATSIQSGEVLAVKSAELSQSEFLQREQKILSSITSPHIVRYKGYNITREKSRVINNLFLEYMPGGSLIDTIQAHGGRLQEPVIAYYTSQIVQGLCYLHSNGLVHSDIKGSNILIGESGAKISDFGCAKWVVDTEGTAETIGGTPMFMAPEVARGEEQGFASDIWSLGCTIIEMASGCPPWPNVNDPVSVMYRIGFTNELPEFPCRLSEQAKDFLEKCLRRDPKQRWAANQLLNHPFLKEFNSHSKQILQQSHNSYSPTSILDQDIWNSPDDESENMDNLVHSSTHHHHDYESSSSSASERIRRLCLIPEGSSWDLDGDEEDWISVRVDCSEEGDAIKDNDDVISYCSMYTECDGEQLLEDVLLDNKTLIRSKVSGYLLDDCNYGKNTSLVCSNLCFGKDKDVMSIPYNSRSLIFSFFSFGIISFKIYLLIYHIIYGGRVKI